MISAEALPVLGNGASRDPVPVADVMATLIESIRAGTLPPEPPQPDRTDTAPHTWGPLETPCGPQEKCGETVP